MDTYPNQPDTPTTPQTLDETIRGLSAALDEVVRIGNELLEAWQLEVSANVHLTAAVTAIRQDQAWFLVDPKVMEKFADECLLAAAEGHRARGIVTSLGMDT